MKWFFWPKVSSKIVLLQRIIYGSRTLVPSPDVGSAAAAKKTRARGTQYKS